MRKRREFFFLRPKDIAIYAGGPLTWALPDVTWPLILASSVQELLP